MNLPSPIAPESVQPGGGKVMAIELAWGRLRRWRLRRFAPDYVKKMADKRQGECPHCPHDIVDPRDLKFCRNVCGYWFKPEDDAFCWRNYLGFARVGFAELLLSSLACGFALVLVALLASLVHPALLVLAIPPALLWAEVLWFFRDPQRAMPDDPRVFVSPADGTITHIDEVNDADFPGGPALRISIFLSIFNVHVNRQPRSGQVVGLKYFPGAFLDARNPESTTRNEQLWIDLCEPDGRLIRVKQISGAIARRIVCWLKLGEEVRRGERLGMIKFGSRTELLMPVGSVEVLVKVGDKVRGGSTALARDLGGPADR